MEIRIRLTRDENLRHFKVRSDAIVTMSVEEYLLGVVPSEVGNSPLEVCKAQAVAARTFATLYAKKGQVITDQASIHQAYRAPRAEDLTYANAHAGVRDTCGQVLQYEGKLIDTCSYSASVRHVPTQTLPCE